MDFTTFAKDKQATDEEEAQRPKFGLSTKSIVVRVIVTGGLAVFALGGVASCAIIDGIGNAEQAVMNDDLSDIKRDRKTLESQEKGMPSSIGAARRIGAAEETAGQLAKFQTVYMAETGKLSYAGVAEEKEDSPGEKYSKEERENIARDNRQSRLDEADRGIKGLVEPVAMTDSGVGLTPWKDFVISLPQGKGVDLSMYAWSGTASPVFDKDGSVPVFFELKKKDDDKVLARVVGTYNPQTRIIEDMELTQSEVEVGEKNDDQR